jgi:hypothetical protein
MWTRSTALRTSIWERSPCRRPPPCMALLSMDHEKRETARPQVYKCRRVTVVRCWDSTLLEPCVVRSAAGGSSVPAPTSAGAAASTRTRVLRLIQITSPFRVFRNPRATGRKDERLIKTRLPQGLAGSVRNNTGRSRSVILRGLSDQNGPVGITFRWPFSQCRWSAPVRKNPAGAGVLLCFSTRKGRSGAKALINLLTVSKV